MRREVIIPETVDEEEPTAVAHRDLAIEQARTRRVEVMAEAVKAIAMLMAWSITCQAVCT